MILVTGGAGFIGANFVLDWFAHSTEPVVNLDKLTYAGNLGSLAALAGDARHVFVRGDIGDRSLRRRAARARIARARSSTSRPRATSTGRSTARRLSSRPTSSARSRCSRPRARSGRRCPRPSATHSASCTSRPTKSSARSRPDDPPFTETTAYAPNCPYSASKAAADHLVRAYHHTYGLPTLTTNCSNNYGPCQFPEKLIPLMIVNALAGKRAAGLRRRRERPRLALRRRSLRGDSRDARARRLRARRTPSAATPR